MTTYHAPTRDMQFVLEELAGIDAIAGLPGFAEQEIGPELVEAILEEAGKLAAEVLAPINQSGDREGAVLDEQGVLAADGFGSAYQMFVDGGWNGLSAPPDYEGQGLPEVLNTAVQEMWQSSNMAFALCPMLTAGAVAALQSHGSEALKARFLPAMISGRWTGTMNLTEPQAGSDLSAVRCRAEPEGEHFRIFGQKIFITWGDHDVAENIVHLVLARTPGAPEGVKGISLFVVPKFLLTDDGSLGERNDVRCVSLEHKLGIHASPTAVMAFGDGPGAVGYLVGEENKGLAYMFTMMNEARLKVGLQGVGIAERAYQQARDYALERVQGRAADDPRGDRVSIIRHPDVRRMLLTMKSQTESMRALCYTVAAAMDLAHHHPEAGQRRAAQARVDLLIPVVKAWCTELGIEIASLGVQVHGGMGYVEETGAAQHWRDARITTIYEGTTGIQAADLAGRKLRLDGGEAMRALIVSMRSASELAAGAEDAELRRLVGMVDEAIDTVAAATDWVLAQPPEQVNDVLAASVHYLMLVGYCSGGVQMLRAATAARERLQATPGDPFLEAKLVTARFYCEQILPRAGAHGAALRHGGSTAAALADEQF